MSTLAEVQALKSVLETGGYYIEEEIAIKVFLATKYRGKGLSTVLLSGPAGAGKTALVETLAGILSAHLEIYQGVPTTSEEALIFDIDIAAVIAKDIPNVNKKGKLIRAIEHSKTKFSILFLDEWDKTRPEMDSFLLSFLQSGQLTGTALGDFQVEDFSKLIVFIAKNNDRELSEPLMRRCRDVPLTLPTPALARSALLRACPRSDMFMMNWILRLYSQQYRAQDKFRKVATIQEMINALLDDDLMKDGYDLEHRKKNATDWMAQYRDDKELFEPMIKATPYSYPPDVYKELGLPSTEFIDAAMLVKIAMTRLRNPSQVEQKRRFLVWAVMVYQIQLDSGVKLKKRITFPEIVQKIQADNEADLIDKRIKNFFWGMDSEDVMALFPHLPDFIMRDGSRTKILPDMLGSKGVVPVPKKRGY